MMQNLILQGLQQKLRKSYSRCNKTLGTSSRAILQPPKYPLLFVNRFRYINNSVTKDGCAIPMDTTIRLGPLKCILRATIDHHGPSIHSGNHTASINYCKKTFYCNDSTITEFGIIDSKNSSTAYIILHELIDILVLDLNRRVGVWSLPRHWPILSIPLTIDNRSREQAPKPVGWMMRFLLMTFVPVQELCVNIYLIHIYLYMHFSYEFCFKIYIYIHTTGVSFSIGEAAPHHILKDCISGECAVPGLNYTFCFLRFTNCVLLSDK